MEGWSWRSEDLAFGAIPIGWRMEKHRARWSLPRCLLTCLRLYVFTGEIFCISSNKTYKLQKFKPSHLCLPRVVNTQFSHPPTLLSFITCITITHPHPSHHTFIPIFRRYYPTQSPRHPLTVGIHVVYRNPPSPSFGPSARGLACRAPLSYTTLRLYSHSSLK